MFYNFYIFLFEFFNLFEYLKFNIIEINNSLL